MSKTISVMVKNLKKFVRDKRVFFMLVFIPVMFYSMMGAIFGGMSYSEISMDRYSIGYVNLDLDGEAPINEYSSIEFITKVLSSNSTDDSLNISIFKDCINFTQTFENGTLNANASVEIGKDALKSGEITALLVFDPGFQSRLNEKVTTTIAIASNSTVDPERANDLISGLINSSSYIYNIINVSAEELRNEIDHCADHQSIDYFISVEDNITLNIFYREDENSQKILQFKYQILALSAMVLDPGNMNSVFTSENPSINATMHPLDCPLPPNPGYTVYFMQSLTPVTRDVIAKTIDSIITNILNYDPDAIEIDQEIATVSGVTLSALTIGSPGYLMYGILSIMSFATSILTREVHGGYFKRLRSSRLTEWQLLFGHFLSNTVVVFVQFTIGILVLAIFGWAPYFADPGSLVFGLILNLLATSLILNALSFILVPVFKSPESASGGVWIVLIPLMAFSGAFFPLELVAPSLVPYVKYLPTRMTILVFQGLMVDGLSLGAEKVFMNLIWQFLMGGLFFIIGIYAFKNFVSKDIVIIRKNKEKEK